MTDTESDANFIESMLAADPVACFELAAQLLRNKNLADSIRARLLRCAGLACIERGCFFQASSYLESGATLANTSTMPLIQLSCMGGAALSFVSVGQFEKALDLLVALLNRSDIDDYPHTRALALTNFGRLYQDIGNLEAALALHQLAGQNTPGGERSSPAIAVNLASVFTELGQEREAILHLLPAIADAENQNDINVRIFALSELGRAQAGLALFNDARTALDTSIDLARRYSLKQHLSRALAYRTLVLLGNGKIAAASADAVESTSIAKRIEHFSSLRYSLGVLALVRRREGETRAELEAIIQRDELNMRLLQLQSKLVISPAKLLLMETKAGNDYLKISKFARGGVALELSAGEQRVLQLLTQGMTNKVIAQQLGLSHHSVRHVVSRITAKLGARNRTEVTRIAMGNRM